MLETRPYLFIEEDQIKKMKSFKYLVIHIETQLKYNDQIKHLKFKITQPCGVSFRLSTVLNFQTAQHLD